MKETIQYILNKYFSSFTYFYRYLGYRIFVILSISILVGILDGFGLAMFLPMLEMVSNTGDVANPEKLGNLAFILDFINVLGFSLTLKVVLGVMFFFFFVKGCFRFLQIYLNTIFRSYFIQKIRETNIIALANFGYGHFVVADVGRIQNTMSGEVERVSNAYQYYMYLIQQLVMVLVYAGLAFITNAQFAILVAIGGAVTNLVFRNLFKKTKKYSQKLTKSSHGFQGLLIQQVIHFKYLKSTGLIQQYGKKLVQEVIEIEKSQIKMGIFRGIIDGSREAILVGVVSIVILIQVYLLGGNLGLIILSILFFYRALTSVLQMQEAYNRFLSLSGSLENLSHFSNELIKGKEKFGEIIFQKFQRNLRLENISFKYGQSLIFKELSLEIRKNETLAIIGESGSGKTTLMNLICGLVKPSQGDIFIDGVDLKELDIRTFQRRIGYITQEPVIFDDTIFNNVTFWAEKSPENINRFWKALEKASILEFVSQQIKLEDCELGNNGISLSGGQKQRISIARELYKEVDFLFMDEATSALDSTTEREIQLNIDRLRGKYTIIIIAHRLSTIKNVDRVALVKNGVIENIGTFQELILKSSYFRQLVQLQGIV